MTGALQLGFADVLQWREARFERITLEDRNLPEIAARRVAPAERGQRASRSMLLRRHREGSPGGVRDPADAARGQRDVPKGLSLQPALVETLVAVSSLLQRERTALKVMLQILTCVRLTRVRMPR